MVATRQRAAGPVGPTRARPSRLHDEQRAETRDYLGRLQSMLEVALEVRARLVNGLADSANGAIGAAVILLRAGQLGNASLRSFREVREASRLIEPPLCAMGVHRAFQSWLDVLIDGCERLAEASAQGNAQALSDGSFQVLQASKYARRCNVLLRDLYARQRQVRVA